MIEERTVCCCKLKRSRRYLLICLFFQLKQKIPLKWISIWSSCQYCLFYFCFVLLFYFVCLFVCLFCFALFLFFCFCFVFFLLFVFDYFYVWSWFVLFCLQKKQSSKVNYKYITFSKSNYLTTIIIVCAQLVLF